MNTSLRYAKKKDYNESSKEIPSKELCILEVEDIIFPPPKKDKISKQNRKKQNIEGVNEEKQENISFNKARNKPSSSTKESEKRKREIFLVNKSVNNKKSGKKKTRKKSRKIE